MKLTMIDKIMFTVAAVLAVVVVALILFGCSATKNFSTDSGLDAGSDSGTDTETDSMDAGPDANSPYDAS